MPVVTDRSEVQDITLRSDEDSLVVRFEALGNDLTGECYEIFSDGTIQLWSPTALIQELNPLASPR